MPIEKKKKKKKIPTAAPPPPAGPNGIRGVGAAAAAAEPRTPSVPRVKLVLLGDSVREETMMIDDDEVEREKKTSTSSSSSSHTPLKKKKKKKKKRQGVGKSCLVLRYVRGCFDPGSKVTVGAAYLGHRATLPDGRACKLEVWDTAGQERYASLAPLYYRGAAAAAVVFDVGDRESFGKARHWVGELQRNAGPGIGKKVLVPPLFCFSSFFFPFADFHFFFRKSPAKTLKKKTVVVLVGNKVDLPEDSRVVPTAEAAEFAER